ncbi:hypothetical protein V6N12_031541 [Hibiscus sabdariffa]|uniref:Aspartate aminotransferase n=1 Tax=Hibiscus sabdariffa TaxID=183260 RepID=A0ABR2CPK0_9ROSI
MFSFYQGISSYGKKCEDGGRNTETLNSVFVLTPKSIYQSLLGQGYVPLSSQNAPNGSFFLLHACAHNPTGVDPTEMQWREISHYIKVKGHFAFFYMAYQGIAQSYAKTMGLYGQRVGCLSVLYEDEKQVAAVRSQLQQLARPMYNNPLVHGALIVSTILGDPNLKKLWLNEVKRFQADRHVLLQWVDTGTCGSLDK